MKMYLFIVLGVMSGLIVGYSVGLNKSDVPVASTPQVVSSPHTGMHDAMNSMTASLEDKRGDEFDKTFLAEMIVHHQGAVEMAEQALAQSERTEIRDLSYAIIEAQNKEIADMRAWQQEWFGQ